MKTRGLMTVATAGLVLIIGLVCLVVYYPRLLRDDWVSVYVAALAFCGFNGTMLVIAASVRGPDANTLLPRVRPLASKTKASELSRSCQTELQQLAEAGSGPRTNLAWVDDLQREITAAQVRVRNSRMIAQAFGTITCAVFAIGSATFLFEQSENVACVFKYGTIGEQCRRGSGAIADLRSHAQLWGFGIAVACLMATAMALGHVTVRLVGRGYIGHVLARSSRSIMWTWLISHAAIATLIGTETIRHVWQAALAGVIIGLTGEALMRIVFQATATVLGSWSEHERHEIEGVEGLRPIDYVRLDEVGIGSAYDLAFASTAELFLMTRYEHDRIADWQDQALLRSMLGAKGARLLARERGIRRATEVVDVEALPREHALRAVIAQLKSMAVVDRIRRWKQVVIAWEAPNGQDRVVAAQHQPAGVDRGPVEPRPQTEAAEPKSARRQIARGKLRQRLMPRIPRTMHKKAARPAPPRGTPPIAE